MNQQTQSNTNQGIRENMIIALEKTTIMNRKGENQIMQIDENLYRRIRNELLKL